MKKTLLLFVLIITYNLVYSQSFSLSSSTTVNLDCTTGGTLFDSGGAGADYGNSQNFVYTICTNGDPLSAEVVNVLMGAGDFLAVFDGPNTGPSPLLFVFDNNNSLLPGTQLRASASNASGCLTFQMSSDSASVGSFEFDLTCLPACQNIEAEVLSSTPAIGVNGANYLDVCPYDTLVISGTGIYSQNNINYAQSDATSNFYWDFGILGVDTGQTISFPIDQADIFPFTLTVEDVNGCKSINELPYTIRRPNTPDLNTIMEDSILCFGDSTLIFGSIENIPIDSFVVGDTLNINANASVQQTVFLPDDSDGNSGNGITTPVIYELPISGYQPGAQMGATADLIEICLDIEHSYIGDLDIFLVCPNGQSVALIDFTPPLFAPFNDFGLANAGDDNNPIPGTPFTYCWSPASTAGSIDIGQPALANDPVLAGTYEAVGNWNNLIGCPLNGDWSIQVFDDYGSDNGYTFGASIQFDTAFLADNDSLIIQYTNPLWQPNPNIWTSLNNDSIQIAMTDTANTEFYFSIEDNLGCVYYDTVSPFVDYYNVLATPDSASICDGDPQQLTVVIDPDDDISCETAYNVYEIPYYKESGVDTSIVFTQADNGMSQIIDLPFDFDVFCVNQSQVRLSTNGYLQFGTSTISLSNNIAIPAGLLPNGFVALMWDDLIDSTGNSSYFTSGVAPNRKFVVNVDLVHLGGTVQTERVLGQIILHEDQNYFDVICENCQNDASDPTASQGVENFTGFFGATTPGRNNTNWSATNSAYRYFPQTSLSTDYVIDWSPAASLSGANTSSPMATPPSTTEYTVDITSVNNCTYSDTITLFVGGNYTTNITPDTVICLGDSIQLEVTGGAQNIAWTPSSGNISDSTSYSPFVMPDTTTTFVAEVDSAGCTAFLEVVVGVSNIEVDTTILRTETCAGEADAEIEIIASGGVNPQYSIDGGASFSTNNLFQPLASGTYNIVVNENGLCDTTYQVIIVGGIPLAFDSIVLSDALCGDIDDGTIEVYLSTGIQPYEYSVDSGATLQDSLLFTGLGDGQYHVFVLDSFSCFLDSIVTLQQPDTLIVDAIQIDSVSCFNSSDGQIELGASGGVAPYLFSDDGINFTANNILSNLEPGFHSVYVQDTNLCVDSALVEVEAPDSIVLTIDSTNITCNGLANGSATVLATGGTPGYSYLWNDALAQNTAIASNLDVGNYQVIVRDQNNCADTTSINIDEPDSLILVVDTAINVLCNGDASGSIAISTTGGTAPYVYAWSNGGGANEDLINALAGTYTLTVTDDNSCTNQITQVITEPSALTINLAETNINCFGAQNGSIDATVGGGVGNYTFAWIGPNGFTANTEDLTGLVAGAYTLTLTDSNNCTLSDIVTIIEPAELMVDFTIDDVNCFGGNDGALTVAVQSVGTTPFTYQWDAAANNQIGVTANGLIAGTYQVTVTDANNCTTTFNETVSEPLEPLSILLSGDNITCAGANNGTVEVVADGGTPGYTYLWNDPAAQTTAQATALAPNTYQVTVTDANGCIESDTVSISEPPAIMVFPVADSANCWGQASGEISVTASGGTRIGYAYSIDGGETFQNSTEFLNLPAGIYDEIVVQDLGSNTLCVSQLYTTTVFEQAYFSFEVIPNDTTLQLEESVDLALNVTSPNYTNASIVQVLWFPTSGLNCSDCVDPTVLTYDYYTEYTATVSYIGDDNVLCNANANTIIQVENNLALFIPNAFTPGGFDEVNKVFEVYGEGIEYVTMQVYNRWGEKVFESSNQKVSWDGTFKGEMQGPGVYSYYVSVEYLDGKKIDRKGSVTLLR